MDIFEYPQNRLAHITYSGKQDSKKPWCNKRRVPNEYILYFLVEGEVFLEEDGISYHMTKGDLLLLEPGKLHFGTKYTDCIFYYVHFLHPDIIKKEECAEDIRASEHKHAAWRTAAEGGPFPEQSISIRKKMHIEDRTALTHFCNLFEQLLARQRQRLEHFGTLGAVTLHEIFIELSRRYARSLFHKRKKSEGISERLNTVLLYLHANYMYPISSKDIELALSYNFDYLNQLFRKHLHISIFKLLENIRMEAAKHILETQSLPIKEIAGEVGYSDEAYFSKAFKRRTGCSPSKFRAFGEKKDL